MESFLFWPGLGLAYEKVAKPSVAIILSYHSMTQDGMRHSSIRRITCRVARSHDRCTS